MSKKIIMVLILLCGLCAALAFGRLNSMPVCLNADEAAFGYNALSILQTGRDEYGAFLPTRFKSFGENKLPILGYLMTPGIALFGLNEFTTRLPTMIVGVLSPVLLFLLTYEFAKNKKVALIAAFLIAVSPWLQSIAHQAHEVVLAYLCISLSLLFFLRYIRTNNAHSLALFSLFNGLALFTHHITKIFAVFFFVSLIFVLAKKRLSVGKWSTYLLLFLSPIILFGFTEFARPTNRVGTLAFYNTSGFTSAIEEQREEHPSRIIHNKVTYAIGVITHQYLTYLSPNFLVVEGDQNLRFGSKGISPITPVEYVLVLIGLCYIFARKEKLRYLLLGVLLASPLPAALAWQEFSMTRSFYMIVPLTILAAYGFYNLVASLKKNHRPPIALVVTALYFFFLFYSWDFYFNHYFKKPDVPRAWQCGYKELGEYVKQNYDGFDRFVITRKNGQPYIYLLYYLQYDPVRYQQEATLSPPDEFGFGQVEKFDKFDFNFSYDSLARKTVFIGFPEDFDPGEIEGLPIKKITYAGHEIFWIVEKR